MNKISLFSVLTVVAFFLTNCKSGLVTTSNACYNLIQSSQAQNDAGDYTSALANFNEILKKCDAYDAKEKGYAGKAEALNGLQQYNDALAAANDGLKIDKNSVDNLFEKASAEMGLGNTTAAKSDFQTILSLMEKNRNTQQRAKIYAKMAAIDSRQQQYSDAQNDIRQAIALDANNADLYILQGDIFTSAGNYTSAVESYNTAIAKGNNSAKAWKAKVEALIKMNQTKYKTNDTGSLAAKMNAGEKQTLCEAIKTGTANGMKDMNIDLTRVAICK